MEFNKYTGIVKLKIYEEDRFFKFGTAHMALLCELLGKSLPEVTDLLGDQTNLDVQIKYYYAAAVSYVRLYNDEHEDKMKEPTLNQVANWFDGLMADQREKINEVAFAQAFPNGEAPKDQTEGQS